MSINLHLTLSTNKKHELFYTFMCEVTQGRKSLLQIILVTVLNLSINIVLLTLHLSLKLLFDQNLNFIEL